VIFRGFVQAGGGSTRFGTDKALVKLAGKSMLRRTGELLASVCHEVSVVSAPGRYADLPWPVLVDCWPGQGPLGGILTALRQLDLSTEPFGSWVTEHSPRSFAVILSCDMPFLTPEFLRLLVDRAKANEAQVVVPECSGRLEPLCAVWRNDALPIVQREFDAGVRKVTEAMKQLRREVLDESAWKRFDSDNRLFLNMNTPEDYETARGILETENR
jgi:molybdenum cofactor guanylyltransferase